MEGPVRTPVQQLNDYLYSQFIILRVVGGNKRFNCKNCLHNFSGQIGRVKQHLCGSIGDVKGCSFSETNRKREVLNEIETLEQALPKSQKQKLNENTVSVAAFATASGSNLKQVPIQTSLSAASKLAVDQALADWMFESGIPAQEAVSAIGPPMAL
jgi:hypothetical protein